MFNYDKKSLIENNCLIRQHSRFTHSQDDFILRVIFIKILILIFKTMKIKSIIYAVLLSGLLLTLLLNCTKDAEKVIPTITNTESVNMGESVTIEINITSDGGTSVISRGVCWSEVNPMPTIGDNKTDDGAGSGIFKSTIGLVASQAYYFRAYATNSSGTAYGSVIKSIVPRIIFSANQNYGSVTDIDGNIYKTITIGTQTWMAENLKTTKYTNGDLIGTTTPVTLDYSSQSTPKYQWSYNGNESYVAAYGRLYTWYAVTDSRGVSPTGWHVPTDAEWKTLYTFLNSIDYAGALLKESGSSHWKRYKDEATNFTGFSALPGGRRNTDGFFGLGNFGFWWNTTENSADYGKNWTMMNNKNFLEWTFMPFSKSIGLSIRCVKD